MHIYLKELNSRFTKDIKTVSEKRSSWMSVEKVAVEIFDQVVKEARTEDFYEFLYYTKSDSTKNTNQNYIMLYAGKKMTGMVSFERKINENGRFTNMFNGVVEDGGGLSIVQSPSGGVFFLVFPCSSKVTTWEDDHLVLKYFDDPKDVNYSNVKEAIEFYLKFMLITSFCSKPTLLEKWKIKWIKFRFVDNWLPITKGFATTLLKIFSAL